MPSTSAKQHRFMEMVAHDPAAAKRVGVPQSVGQDFAAADAARATQKQVGAPERGHTAHTSRMHARGKSHGAKHGG